MGVNESNAGVRIFTGNSYRTVSHMRSKNVTKMLNAAKLHDAENNWSGTCMKLVTGWTLLYAAWLHY